MGGLRTLNQRVRDSIRRRGPAGHRSRVLTTHPAQPSTLAMRVRFRRHAAARRLGRSRSSRLQEVRRWAGVRTTENHRDVFPLLTSCFLSRLRGRPRPGEGSPRSTREQPDPATQQMPHYLWCALSDRSWHWLSGGGWMAEFQEVETSFSGGGDCCRCQEEGVQTVRHAQGGECCAGDGIPDS